MKARFVYLACSVAILCYFGLRSLWGMFRLFATNTTGLFSSPVQTGATLGAILSVVIMFMLAIGQSKTRGRWSVGIGIFSFIILLAQSFLLYIAITRGGVPASTKVFTRFFLTGALPLLLEIVFCVLLYLNRKKEANQ